jgi:hypothetical protein
VIIFGSVRFLLKKITKLKFFFEKKTETGSNRPVSVRFGLVFLEQKPVRTGLVRFSRFWLSFLGFGSVFSGFGSVFFGFFWFFVGFGLVRFFQFFVYKTETKPNRPVFSKI